MVAERFYADLLGEVFGFGAVESRYMLSTDELLEAQRRTEARARSDGELDSWVSRTPHSNVTVGSAKISLYLAPYHIQEAPPEQLRGAPRLALSATPEQLDRAVDIFKRNRVPFEGPVTHAPPSLVSRSLYFRDPAGNFLELCCPRKQ